ncbi:ATP-binding cassette domain-containing protein [uncultured Algimonas sp.]|uniref:ATP-binding cassette domain-containing protein n=1 Tax=uncultured Algimonas sp. TaxID=1547920 RepID=UPI002603598C|nr:ATP-binding cassette domain-containing protein [uncultured Algimonas sp.]
MSLSAQDVTVAFGPRTILDKIDARIEPGLVTAILGPNGAGKTTLLRVLSGDQSPDSGTVRLGDTDIATLSSKDLASSRAVLPQHIRPAFGFKAWEMVRLGRSPFGETSSKRLLSVERALSRVDASHLAERDINTLSGGERQRVFLAKALCQAEGRDGRSGYLLLDEPAAALDMKQAASLMKVLRRTAEAGIGIAIIAHDVRAMKHYADRFLLVAEGNVETHECASDLNAHCVAALYHMDPEDIAV